MLHLLNPIGLTALAALLVPLAIHLWRVPRQTVRLGSLQFLEAGARPRLNQFRWRERLLLALRLALLALCAALLARPEWWRMPATPARWALFSPGALPLSDEARGVWETLRTAGWEPHLLAPGLPKLPAATDLAVALSEAKGGDALAHAPLDIWSLLREADARVAAGSTFAVFAPRRVVDLPGPRPTLAHTGMRWVDTPERRRTRWIDTVTRSNSSPILSITIGVSAASGTRFLHGTISPQPGRATIEDAEIEIAADGGAARLVDAVPTPWVPVTAPAPIAVVVYYPETHLQDARAVTAAVRAVSVARSRDITVTTNPASELTERVDWAFCLGGAGPTAEVLQRAMERGMTLVTDAGAVATGARVALIDAAFRVSSNPAERIPLWRRVAVQNETGAALAADSFGAPVLTVERVGRGRQYRFYSRFHPEWTGWTESSRFPAWIDSLLLPGAEASGRASDIRVVGADQVELATARAAPYSAPIPEKMELSMGCWWLAVGLFLAERSLSHRWRWRTPHPPMPEITR